MQWICCRSRHLTTRAKECARLEARQWIRKEAQRRPRDRKRDIRESRQRCKDNGSQNGRRQKPPICLQHSSKWVAWGSSKMLNLRTYRYSLPKWHQIVIVQQIKVGIFEAFLPILVCEHCWAHKSLWGFKVTSNICIENWNGIWKCWNDKVHKFWNKRSERKSWNSSQHQQGYSSRLSSVKGANRRLSTGSGLARVLVRPTKEGFLVMSTVVLVIRRRSETGNWTCYHLGTKNKVPNNHSWIFDVMSNNSCTLSGAQFLVNLKNLLTE